MSDSKLVGRGADQYTVRFPDGLRDRLKEAAAANGRSMNTEIIALLEGALSQKYQAIPRTQHGMLQDAFNKFEAFGNANEWNVNITYSSGLSAETLMIYKTNMSYDELDDTLSKYSSMETDRLKKQQKS